MIKITSDSTADLGKNFLERNIVVIPIAVVLGDNVYDDGVDVTPQTIYDFVAETGKLPKTSTRSVGEYYDIFEKLTADGSTVIHFSLSSGISSTCEHAQQAAEQLKNVYVIDTQSLSSGSGLLALYAADLRDEGKYTAEQIVEKVNARVDKVQASFVVDSIEYLYKGGRCSGLAAFAGAALKIKPSLILREGKIKPSAKYMGSLEKNMEKYCNNIISMYNTPDKTRVFVTYTEGTNPKLVEIAKRVIKEKIDPEQILETTAGSVITAHCGKGTIGILYINDGE